jgi:hypothetical protein
MPRVSFEPMIPVFELAKAVHALGRGATVVDYSIYTCAESIIIRFLKGRASYVSIDCCKQQKPLGK